jgi:hypothetical protein
LIRFAAFFTDEEPITAFRIENNLIRRVEMIGTSVPYHFNSTWARGLSGK